MFCIMYRVKSNEIFVFHYNLLLLGSIWSNPVFKPLSFFLSDRHTSNSRCFDLRRRISGWASLLVVGEFGVGVESNTRHVPNAATLDVSLQVRDKDEDIEDTGDRTDAIHLLW